MYTCPSSSFSLLVVPILSLRLLFLSCSAQETHFKGIDLGSPILSVTPTPLSWHPSAHASKDVLLCDRVKVSGHSWLDLGSYANSFRVTLAPSVSIPRQLHSKMQVCFHRNASLGLCQCEKDDWISVQKGLWQSIMSPYDVRYIDVKFIDDVSGTFVVALKEDFQQWRLWCLALGFFLWLLAPIVSKWIPFYYSSSMAIGIFLVIIILLFQGMKLLPAGRKNVFYLTIYGSAFGVGSYLVHYFSMLVNSSLVSLGLSEEMQNPVAVFLLVGIILSGAALGYWIVRKFVISKNGTVDVGIANFVKWAMRIIASTLIFQSTLDNLMAVAALASCGAICSLIPSRKQHRHLDQFRWAIVKPGRAEFLSRSPRTYPKEKLWNSPISPPAWSNSPVRGVLSSSTSSGTRNQDYYSTFHKKRNRKKFTKQEWEDFTRESTRKAMAELAATPEFIDWVIERADRIKLISNDSTDESIGSKSSSIDEEAEESSSQFRFFSWKP
ncbi:hypothetical protein SLE2022_055340 [Rubroshorea leprosula]